jgi:uncharacterized membrane protein
MTQIPTEPTGAGPGDTPPSSMLARPPIADAAWGVPSGEESRWPPVVAVLIAIGLQVVLPTTLIHGLGPRWLVPALEGVLLVALLIANPHRLDRAESNLRLLSIAMIAVITVANVVALGELIRALLDSKVPGGRALVFASVPIWITNVIAFGLWYWELDRGGVTARMLTNHRQPDLLFPQMSVPEASPGWAPHFIDYLYVSFTNATAFSPTDTMPLTSKAKLLMMAQSLASLLTVALVVSRAVNILK